MTFTHEDIRDRLVDYLYGQLEGDARAAFRAHLDACPVCRGEVTGAERARAVAREVVRRPLADPVPDRARARAFEAARAAVAGHAAAGPSRANVTTTSALAQAAPAAPSRGEGWFRRLRRRWTWTFPTFATFAAVAVFLLVRATIFREAKTPVSAERLHELARPEAALPPPSGSGQPLDDERRLNANLPNALGDVQGSADRNAQQGQQGQEDKQGQQGKAAKRAAESAPSDGAPRVRLRRAPAGPIRHPDSEQALGGLSSSVSSRGAGAAPPLPAVPAARMVAPKKAAPLSDELGDAADEERARARREKERAAPNDTARLQSARPKAELEAVKAESSRRASATPQRDFAVPPPPAAVAPAPSAPAAKGNAAAREAQQDEVETASAPAPAQEAPAAAQEKKTSKKLKEPMAPAAAPQTRSQDRGQDSARDSGGHEADHRAATGAAPDPALARGSRAESLMNQRRWAEAITILRDLLRRYPAHPAAPRWRSLLDAAQTGLNAPEEMFATPPPPR